VAPPSQHASGTCYTWARPLTAASPEVPAGLRRLPPPGRGERWILAGLVVEVLMVERRDAHCLPLVPVAECAASCAIEPALVFPCFAIHPRGLVRAPSGEQRYRSAQALRRVARADAREGDRPLSVRLGLDPVLPPWPGGGHVLAAP